MGKMCEKVEDKGKKRRTSVGKQLSFSRAEWKGGEIKSWQPEAALWRAKFPIGFFGTPVPVWPPTTSIPLLPCSP
jgi:hypothetical protein